MPAAAATSQRSAMTRNPSRAPIDPLPRNGSVSARPPAAVIAAERTNGHGDSS